MICIRTVKSFCNEDISLIENYEKAINDDAQTWHCHHRRETDEGLSKKQLKELGLYYGRPANELIFLTCAEHVRLHHKNKYVPEETKQNLSAALKGRQFNEEWKQRMSESHIGKPANIRGRHKVWNDENDHSKGYHYEK